MEVNSGLTNYIATKIQERFQYIAEHYKNLPFKLDANKYGNWIYFPNAEYIHKHCNEAVKQITADDLKRIFVTYDKDYPEITTEIFNQYKDKNNVNISAHYDIENGDWIYISCYMTIHWQELETNKQLAVRIVRKAVNWLEDTYRKEYTINNI